MTPHGHRIFLACFALLIGRVGAAPQDSHTRAGPSRAWPVLSAEQQSAAVVDLKQTARDIAAKLSRPLKLLETHHFLLSCELDPPETEKCARLLEQMNAKLAELFAVPKDQNLWRGKALVFVFADADGYRQFESKIAGVDPGESAGMCHCFDDGTVQIAFYRQPDELTFAHALVHESVHGFMHRYRGRAELPSWVNEGLAEMIAAEMAPRPDGAEKTRAAAREALARHKDSIGDFFIAEHIARWQYPVAETFCAFMISTNQKGYIEFINALKDGVSCPDALNDSYHSTLDQLPSSYARWLGPKPLRP